MKQDKIIGKVSHTFSGLCCVGIRLIPQDDVALEVGMTLRFLRKGKHVTYDKVHKISSIEVNLEKRNQVTHKDGTCTVYIGGLPSNLPPCGCTVTLINKERALFEQFKSEIVFDAHNLQTRYNRSEARKELLEKASVEVLRSMITYLRKILPIEDEVEIAMKLEVAWVGLMQEMCTKLNLSTKSTPSNSKALDWCDWVENKALAN